MVQVNLNRKLCCSSAKAIHTRGTKEKVFELCEHGRLYQRTPTRDQTPLGTLHSLTKMIEFDE